MQTAGAPQVTKDDQQRINLFGRLNIKFKELQEKVKAKKKYCEDLEDASSELMLCDEEQVKYSFGWVFVHMDTDGADTRLESATEEAREEITQLEGEIGDVRKNMDELKGVLYAKFGSAINLEEE